MLRMYLELYAKMEKRMRNISRADVMSDFVKDSVQNGATIFGGAVRDMIAEVEPTDIDIYFYARDPLRAEERLVSFIKSMPIWTFERLTEPGESIDWTYYSMANRPAPALVVPFLVMREEIQFKVDIVMSHHELCFSNLDCIVNGLVMDSEGISFVTNFHHAKLKKRQTKENVEIAKQLIGQRIAGMFPEHRFEKMRLKGYNVDVF